MASKSTQDNGMNSKVMIIVLLAIAFAAGFYVARLRYKPQINELRKMAQEKTKEADEVKLSANKVMMKDSQIWLVEKGVANVLDANIMFSNGDRVMMDGMIIRADGTEIMMEEGQSMDMNGKMIDAK